MNSVSFVAMLAVTGSALGAAQNFSAPVWRNGANATFAGWESFTSSFAGPNFADDAQSTASATITQTTVPNFNPPPGILISGEGNLYSGFQNMNMVLAAGAADDVRRVILQVRTLGTELNYAGVALKYFDAQNNPQTLLPVASRQLFSEAGVPVFGNPSVNVEWKFRWDLSSLGDTVTSFSIGLTHFAPHLSLDRAEVDVQSVPAPGAAALAGVLGLTALRRRRA